MAAEQLGKLEGELRELEAKIDAAKVAWQAAPDNPALKSDFDRLVEEKMEASPAADSAAGTAGRCEPQHVCCGRQVP